jgi:quinol monooxygenase YgiN
MIHVLAIITANPGQRQRVLEAFQANVPAVRAEEGCIEYGAAVDTEGFGGLQTAFGPDTFVVIEKWQAPRRSRRMRLRRTWPPMGQKPSR